VVDIDGFFHQVPIALILAEVRADPTYGKGHGETLSNKLQSLDVLSLGNEANVALNIYSGRTG
jgi:hypothetical protein